MIQRCQLISKTICAFVMLGALITISGCTNFEEKYNLCAAERENLEALYEGSDLALNDSKAINISLEGQNRSLLAQLKTAKAVSVATSAMPTLGFNGEDVKYDASRGTITVTLSNATLFDSGSIRIKTAAKSRLKGIVREIIKRYSDKEISVIGHTDTDPIKKSKWKDNWQLSTERSLSVTRYLLSQGLKPDQLVASGRGQFDPIGKSKSKNRRVEIVVHAY